MKNTTITNTTITKIELSLSDSPADITHLSDGRMFAAWNGQVCYNVYDEAKGNVMVGARLVAVEDDESCQGEVFKNYTFA